MNTDRIDGNLKKRSVPHPMEREAVALLYQSGWSTGELAMTFQASKGAIHRILHDEGVLE